LDLFLEHGFMSTPIGRSHYFFTFKTNSTAINETDNFGVLHAYLTVHDNSENNNLVVIHLIILINFKI